MLEGGRVWGFCRVKSRGFGRLSVFKTLGVVFNLLVLCLDTENQKSRRAYPFHKMIYARRGGEFGAIVVFRVEVLDGGVCLRL